MTDNLSRILERKEYYRGKQSIVAYFNLGIDILIGVTVGFYELFKLFV